MGIGRWAMRCALWGPTGRSSTRASERIRAAWRRDRGRRPSCTRARTRPDEYHELEVPHDKIQAGIPNLDIIRDDIGATIGHVGFSPVVPLTGRDVREAVDLLRDLIEREAQRRLPRRRSSSATSARCVIVTGANFDTSDEEQVRRVYDACKMLVAEAGKHGYGEYRAHLDFMDLASDQYSFNDHAYRRFCETIKDAVDPNGHPLARPARDLAGADAPCGGSVV